MDAEAAEARAVPHRTYAGVNSPWVPPGAYTVRLTVNGKSMSQPITVKMDPRVRITPEVQQIFTLTVQIEDSARNAETAYRDARALAAKVKARPQSAANDALLKQLEELAPEVAATGGGRGGRGGGGTFTMPGEAAPASNLSNLASHLIAAIQPMQAAEMPPTAAQLAACNQAQATYGAVMAKWAALRAKAGGQTASAPAAGGHGAAK